MLRLCKLKKRPTAIFISNYDMTIGAYLAINYLRLKIPEDISVIGFDNWSYVKKKYKLNVTNFPFFVIVNSLSLLGPFPSFSDIVPHIHLETNIHNDYEYGLYYRMFQYIQKLVYMHECS